MVASAVRPALAQVDTSRAAAGLTTAPQRMSADASVDSLVQRALAVSPQLRAARERARAAEARVVPATTRPDPMLMAGIQNFPVSEPGFGDFMTMKMVGVSQSFPFPGKLAGARRVADAEAEAARVEVEGVGLMVGRDVRSSYFDIAYIDQALAIVGRTRDVLVGLIQATEARYATGGAGQEDVLRARLEVARLGDEASALQEERRAATARLNALLDQPTATPLVAAAFPASLTRLAVADAPARITFASTTLGSRVSDSPLPPLDSLATLALARSPMIRAQAAMVAAQAARTSLARLESRPDLDVSLEYGQRNGLSDMVSARISLPLPLQQRRRQEPLAAAAAAEQAAGEADLQQQRNVVRAEVARLHAQLERDRTQLALTVKAILPQSRATLEAAAANYQAGRTTFVAVLEAQATLFNTETTYFRALSDFAKTLAELEQVVGGEIRP